MQDGRKQTQGNLWRITAGQRLRYLSATAATGVSSGFMLLAPLVGMYAIDVIVERDFDKGSPWLVEITRLFDQGDAFLVYLGVSALAGLLLASLSALFMYLRGRWSAIATEAIARRLRDALFHRLHHLPAGSSTRPTPATSYSAAVPTWKPCASSSPRTSSRSGVPFS